jgi:hypothetical protein
MGSQKIGFIHEHTEPTTYHNQPALRSVSSSITRLVVLGTTVNETESEATISDLQYNPLEQIFDVNSQGSAMHLEAVYDYAAHKITCRLRTGDTITPKTLTIPKDAILTEDPNFATLGKKLSPGQKVTMYSLDPLSVALDKMDVEIGNKETIQDSSGKSLVAQLVTADMPLGKVRTWTTEDGDIVKGELSLGGISLLMVKEPEATAQDFSVKLPDTHTQAGGSGAAPYTPPADFAVLTAITTDKPIAKPRHLRSLHVTITGVPDKRLVLSDPRQRATILPTANAQDGITVQLNINAASFDAAKSVELPVTDSALAPYLNKAAYLDTSNAKIRRTAATLRGHDRNAYRVACRIRDWVHNSMTPDLSIGVPRSATDIYEKRRGVCRDYATLYTTLARAAGIPTRLCGGIVYAEGKFYYHAWAESYVGRWIAFDPTLYDPDDKVDYVDATHIKFTQGDVDNMFNVISVVGKLRITVQDTSS